MGLNSRDLREKVALARQEAQAGVKEIFDFQKFAAIYPHDTGGRERLMPDASALVQAYYEEMYYLDYPQVKSIEAFAKLLDVIDTSD